MTYDEAARLKRGDLLFVREWVPRADWVCVRFLRATPVGVYVVDGRGNTYHYLYHHARAISPDELLTMERSE